MNARLVEGFEVWTRGGLALISEQPFGQFSLTSAWRTPSMGTSPRHEVMPTVEYFGAGVVRPYVALNAAIALLLFAPTQVWISGGLAVGVHFDFGEK